jgi:hypothetical protein
LSKIKTKAKVLKEERIKALKQRRGQPDLPKRGGLSDPKAAAPVSATSRGVEGAELEPRRKSMASHELGHSLRNFRRGSMSRSIASEQSKELSEEGARVDQKPAEDAAHLVAPPPPPGSSRERYLAWLLGIGYNFRAAGVVAIPILRSATFSSSPFLFLP